MTTIKNAKIQVGILSVVSQDEIKFVTVVKMQDCMQHNKLSMWPSISIHGIFYSAQGKSLYDADIRLLN